jgi:hypothetical protein
VEDRWGAYGPMLGESAPTIKEMKAVIKAHIMGFELTRAKTEIEIEDYEITDVKLTIKKKK